LVIGLDHVVLLGRTARRTGGGVVREAGPGGGSAGEARVRPGARPGRLLRLVDGGARGAVRLLQRLQRAADLPDVGLLERLAGAVQRALQRVLGALLELVL